MNQKQVAAFLAFVIPILAWTPASALAIKPLLSARGVACPTPVSPAVIGGLRAYLRKPAYATLILESDGFAAFRTLPPDSELAQIMVGLVAEQADALHPRASFDALVERAASGDDPKAGKDLAAVLRSSLKKAAPKALALLDSVHDALIEELKRGNILSADAEKVAGQYSAAHLFENGRLRAEHHRRAVRALIEARRFRSEFEPDGRLYDAVAEISADPARSADQMVSFALEHDDLRLHEFAARRLAEILDLGRVSQDAAMRPLLRLASTTNSLEVKRIAIDRLVQLRYLAPAPAVSSDRFDDRARALLALDAQFDGLITHARVISGILRAAVELFSRDPADAQGLCAGAVQAAARLAETVGDPWLKYFSRAAVLAARRLPAAKIAPLQPLLDRLPAGAPRNGGRSRWLLAR